MDGEEEEEVEETGPPPIDPATGKPMPRPKKKKRARMGRRKMLENMSTKPTDFQVIFPVLQCPRKLK